MTNDIKDLQKGITEILVKLAHVETEIKQIGNLASKLDHTEKTVIEAMQSTKAAHKRLDEMSKTIETLEKRIEEDKKHGKDDKKWLIGTAIAVVSVILNFIKWGGGH